MVIHRGAIMHDVWPCNGAHFSVSLSLIWSPFSCLVDRKKLLKKRTKCHCWLQVVYNVLLRVKQTIRRQKIKKQAVWMQGHTFVIYKTYLSISNATYINGGLLNRWQLWSEEDLCKPVGRTIRSYLSQKLILEVNLMVSIHNARQGTTRSVRSFWALLRKLSGCGHLLEVF